MLGTLVCEVIPFHNIKEKIKLTKKYKDYKIEIFNNFILVEGKRDVNEVFNRT